MRSLRMKLVMILVILILALMTVIGAFLINGVGSFYISEFYVQMEQTFSPDFIAQLQRLPSQTDDAPAQMNAPYAAPPVSVRQSASVRASSSAVFRMPHSVI